MNISSLSLMKKMNNHPHVIVYNQKIPQQNFVTLGIQLSILSLCFKDILFECQGMLLSAHYFAFRSLQNTVQ
jgi:hypothetical protein